MSWNLTRKTGALALGYLIILGILAIDLIFTVVEIQKVAEDSNQAITNDYQIVAAVNLTLQRFLTETYSYLQTRDPSEYEEGAEMLAALEELMVTLRTLEHEHSDFQGNTIQEHAFASQAEMLWSTAQQLHRRLPSSTDALTDAQYAALYEEIETIEGQREVFAQQANTELTAMSDIARQHIAEDVTLTFVGIAIALVAMVVLTAGALWLINRQIVRPLRSMTSAADRLAEGRLEGELPVTSADEIGVLQQTFNRMAATIRQQTSALDAHYRQVKQAHDSLEAAHQQAVEQLTIIQQQRDAIRELSVPVLPVSHDTLVMPLVGALDSTRLIQAQEQALKKLEATRARNLLLDITGVPVVDSHVAQGLIRLVQAARLLGAEVTLVGIRPEVAQSIIGLGISLSGIRTRTDLQNALMQKS